MYKTDEKLSISDHQIVTKYCDFKTNMKILNFFFLYTYIILFKCDNTEKQH